MVPGPCLASEYCHCLRNEQREEDTTANVRVVRDTEIESKPLREHQLADATIAPVLKWKELGQRQLVGCVCDERRSTMSCIGCNVDVVKHQKVGAQGPTATVSRRDCGHTMGCNRQRQPTMSWFRARQYCHHRTAIVKRICEGTVAVDG